MAQQERIEFLLAAQVEGQQQMKKLIESVDALRAETEKLKGANAGLTSSTDAVVRNGKRYNTVLDAQAKELRNARQGTQQLGMQFNDLATSISTGASPMQAFSQQLGQIGFALSMMPGRLGAVGNFLAGPWGAALLIGGMAVSFLIDKLSAAGDAAEELQVMSSSLGMAQSALGDMFDLSSGKIKSNTTETRLNTLAKIANLRVTALQKEADAKSQYESVVDPGLFGRMANNAKDIVGAIYTPGEGLFPGFSKDFVKNLDNSRKNLDALYKTANATFADLESGSKTAAKEIENLFKKGDTKFQQYLLDRLNAMNLKEIAKEAQKSFDQGVVAASLLKPSKSDKADKAKEISETDKLRAAQEAVIAEYEAGKLSLAEFETKLVGVTEAFKDAKNPAEDYLNQFKKANQEVDKFKKSTDDLTAKSVPSYIKTLRDLEDQYEAIQKNEKMTSDLQIRFMNAIKATATGPIDDLIKKYDNLHTGMTQFEQDLAAAKAVIDALSAENGEAAGAGAKAALEAFDRLTKAMGDAKIREKNQEIEDSFENIGKAVANSFRGMITGAMSFRDAMKGIIGAVIDELFRLFVVQQIVGVVKGALSSAFGIKVPGRAVGGPVSSNQPYMVGERGPELFVPRGNGTIIPNHNMKGGAGAGGINITVDARGSSDPAAVRAQVQQGILEAAPAIIAAAEARTNRGLRRPRLAGVM